MRRISRLDLSSRASRVWSYSYQSAVLAFAWILLAVLTGCGGGGGTTSAMPSSAQASLSLSALPSTSSVHPGTGFLLRLKANRSGTTAVPSITLGALPAGFSTKSSFPMSVPDSGATVEIDVAANVASGTYSVPINGTAGGATAATSASINVLEGTPSAPYFVAPSTRELTVTQGSSTSVQSQVMGSSTVKVALSTVGLPPGTTAVITPQVVQTGESFTVTISATSGAPLSRNSAWSIVGAPAANVQMASLPLVLNVTGTTSVGWNNRTDYVSTRATPDAAVYDRANELIYLVNNTWNRIDIVSNLTHAIVSSVPVRDPRRLDLSIDGTHVWVATGSQVMYGIDTATFKAASYLLPRFQITSSSPGYSWEGTQVASLADGTVLLRITDASREYVVIWDPATNALDELREPTGESWGLMARSGDGKFVFSVGGTSSETCFSYDVLKKSFSTPVRLAGYGLTLVVNHDGSRIAISDVGSGFNLFDGNFVHQGTLPGDGGYIGHWLLGGSVFSPDGSILYEETLGDTIPLIVTIDVATRQVTGLAPAMAVIPVMHTLSPPYHVPEPFGVDNTGMILGVQYHGIAFDDSLAHFNYVDQAVSPTKVQHSNIYSGPLAGGTTSAGFGNAFSTKPDVYYGWTKGTATLSQGILEITSPPATSPGPVNVKMLFANGVQVFNPQFFTYGTVLQDAILSGAPPEGNVPGKLSAFGLPSDPTQDVVTVGGNRGTVTSVPTQYPPLTDEQTAMFLSYTVPAGVPGWADISVATTNGTGTLPRAMFYARSVTDYASPDTNTFVLYDRSRNKLFLSAGDHINVFSLASNSFTGRLQPPAIGSNKQFQGLSLTSDNKYLLAANLIDGSLAVIDPDEPANAYAVSVTLPSTNDPTCIKGPLFTAATDRGQAVVVTGGVVGLGCGPGGQAFIVDLATRTSSKIDWTGCGISHSYVSATTGGGMIVFDGDGFGGFQIYDTAQQRCTPFISSFAQIGATAAGDGNVFATNRAFVDRFGNILGRMASPPVLYPANRISGLFNYSPYQDGALQVPVLNDSGSLYYWAYPNYIDIVDVQHGIEKLRFSLGRTVSNVVSPLAIDADGRHLYLITNKGLTIVDLGQAPLSVGHLSQNTAAPGADIVVRGSGFQSGITLAVSGRAAAVTYTDSSTLTFTVPSVAAGLQDLVLKNPDGTTYILENGLTVQ